MAEDIRQFFRSKLPRVEFIATDGDQEDSFASYNTPEPQQETALDDTAMEKHNLFENFAAHYSFVYSKHRKRGCAGTGTPPLFSEIFAVFVYQYSDALP